MSAPPFSSLNLGAHVGDDPAAVSANRELLRERLGLDAIVWMDQVHSAVVRPVLTVPDGPVLRADGLVTRSPGIGLGVLVADCVPVLAVDEVGGVVGAAHAGRRGAAAGIGAELIRSMVAAGARPDRIAVVLGPAVCGGCYEVPAAMRDEVERDLPGSAARTRGGTPALNLAAGLTRQFTALGVRSVRSDGRCTVEDGSLFSHRRAGVTGSTGRQAGVVWLTP